ncbi:hypothetical protein AB0N16_16840 [Streptomyces sp. NPDC051105]|uniref:hypothetical protein n=1 Tax=Streptomyces sp. NPDC051105 TaxID=3154843 RepID=UPI00343B2440
MLLRRTPSGRRGAVTAASAAAVCLASALTACGGGEHGGYTAVGAAGTAPGAAGTSSRPTGSVTLVPLDGSPAGATHGSPSAEDGRAAAAAGPADPAASAPTPSSASSHRDGTRPRRSDPPTPNPPQPTATSPTGTSPTGTSPTTTPGGTSPAALTWSTPTREPTDQRWCEKVTVEFRNSGGTAVRSGTVTLGTHIIDLLGIDWATIGSTEALPAPVAPHSRTSGTWTVCVDDWRVPLGMHVETRVVAVAWR